MLAENLRLDQATKRLLLLAAREKWDSPQYETAIGLAKEVGDWNRLAEVANSLLGVGLVHQALAKLPSELIPAAMMVQMKAAARMFAVRSLASEAALLEFKTNCLDALGVKHAFFKGAALAHRYYDKPAVRAYRDVDVLIDPARSLEVVRHAISCGYVPAEHVRKGDRGLVAWVKRTKVYPVMAPSGTLIEIHRSLDNDDGMVDTAQALSNAETMSLQGHLIPTLNTADLFVYICVHHTRHFWSHLHWYADLDAISRHPLFDMAQIQEVAKRTKLVTTVDACLRLNEFARSGKWSDAIALNDGPGEALLIRSLECLEGGIEHEKKLKLTRLSMSRAFGWQASALQRLGLIVRREITNAYKTLRKRLGELAKALLPERMVEWIKHVRS